MESELSADKCGGEEAEWLRQFVRGTYQGGLNRLRPLDIHCDSNRHGKEQIQYEITYLREKWGRFRRDLWGRKFLSFAEPGYVLMSMAGDGTYEDLTRSGDESVHSKREVFDVGIKDEDIEMLKAAGVYYCNHLKMYRPKKTGDSSKELIVKNLAFGYQKSQLVGELKKFGKDAQKVRDSLHWNVECLQKLHLSAPAIIARFQRPTGQNTSKYSGNSVDKRKNTAKVSINHGRNIKPNSFVHAVKGSNPGITINNETPTMVLDDDCVNQEDYSHRLNGKIKDFEALTNLKTVLGNEGFNDVVLRYLGGMWVMLMFKSMEEKEIFKLNVGIGSWFSKIIQTTMISFRMVDVCLGGAKDNIMETIKITFKGKSYWLRVKEVPGGVPISKLSKGRSMNLGETNDGMEQKSEH
ncbi:hypothetical protein Tco_0976106 [Tanacetum coccineum]|uniref:Uncharacterized protein n=1 Tax=Tanacetum coccineum TaxID=301880 RepID=A0ABQ5EGA5_9ASTR